MSRSDDDHYDLQRFVEAQESQYASVCSELARGRKTGHWMWFVFPQIEGLGTSPTARMYAISGLDEARQYLAHETLGDRLRHCTRLVCEVRGHTAEQIFGHPDYMKFRSSMTLFAHASADDSIFTDALKIYFGGEPDARTLALLPSSVKER